MRAKTSFSLSLLLAITVLSVSAIMAYAESYNATIPVLYGVDTGFDECYLGTSMYSNNDVIVGCYSYNVHASTNYVGLILRGNSDNITSGKILWVSDPSWNANDTKIYAVKLINETHMIIGGMFKNDNIFLALLDENGVVWKKQFYDYYNLWAGYNHIVVRDGYVYYTGYYCTGPTIDVHPFIIKLNATTGSLVMFKYYNIPGWNFYALTFAMDSAGNFILTTHYWSTGPQPIILKIDSTGSPLWGIRMNSPYGEPKKVLVDSQDNIYVIARIWNSTEPSSVGLIKILPNGTVDYVKAFKDEEGKHLYVNDAVLSGDSILVTGMLDQGSSYNLFFMNITGNNIEYLAAPIPTQYSFSLFTGTQPNATIVSERIINVNGVQEDYTYLIQPSSSWNSRQLQIVDYQPTIVSLSLTPVTPSITLSTPNMMLATINLTTRIIYNETITINARYDSNTGKIKLETINAQLEVGSRQGNPLYISPDMVSTPTTIKADNKDTGLYLASYSDIIILANTSLIGTSDSEKITITLQTPGKISIGSPEAGIEKIIVDGSLLCSTVSACNQLINNSDNLITLNGQVFKIYPNQGPRPIVIEMTSDRMMLVSKVHDLNNHVNSMLDDLLSGYGAQGESLEEKLESTKQEDPQAYRELVRSALDQTNVPQIFQELLDKGLIMQTITLPEEGRESLRETLESIYGPALINYPDPEGRIYLLYTLYQ